jgi:guanylate kinase
MIGNKRIILVGPGGSGKDHLRKIMESRGFTYSLSFTSRPIRENETEGKDYPFTTPEYFEKNRNKFYEIAEFNGWKYGTLTEDFYSKNLFIMTPSGISNIKKEDRKSSFIIYLNPTEEIRRKRLSERRDADSLERRLEADRKDFENFEDFDMMITNENF